MTSPASLRLELRIQAADLANIRAAQLRIVLARAASATAPAVVWRSLDPFEINTITWSEDTYGLYATTAPLWPGTWLSMVSRLLDAQGGYYYAFTSGASFQGPYWASGIGAEKYGVLNAMPHASYPVLTFGLCQPATVNGSPTAASPASAQAVLAERLATFPRLPRVYVWLDDSLTSATAISGAGANAALVDLTNTPTPTLIFDPDLGRFVPEPPLDRSKEMP